MMGSSKEEKEGTEVILNKERSLDTIPPTHAPSILFTHGKNYHEHTFYTLSDGCYHARSIPEMRQRRCIASCYGWLIMQDHYDSTDCYLFNPVALKTIYLPRLMHKGYFLATLTSPPTDINCFVVCLSSQRRSLVYCHIGDEKWTEKSLVSIYEISELDLSLSNLLTCKGKIYVAHIVGMFAIDLQDDSMVVHTSFRHPGGSLPEVCFKNYFVESRGEIFLVVMLLFGTSSNITQTFDVFKLDFGTMDWALVESLGDRILLLGAESGTSLSSSELGVKGNCIYFVSNMDTSLYRFDMQDGTITTTLPCPEKMNDWYGPFWVVPNCELQVKEAAKEEYARYELNKDLSQDLLELILSSPCLGDCICFRLICKARLTIIPPIRAHTSLIPSEYGSQHLPWLMSFPKNNMGLCKLYHPIYSDAYTMHIPNKLAGAIVRCAKYGWLLMSQGELSIFFYNPLTMEIIQLPDHHILGNISFSSPPTLSDCIVFGNAWTYKDSVKLILYRKSEDAWSHYVIHTPYTFCASVASPVFCDGVFYSLGEDGKLGIFNPNETKKKNMWRLLPDALVTEPDFSSWFSLQSFLMEYDGEILSVFIGHLGKPVLVKKLDKSKMKWIEVESLGEKVIFLSHTTSILVPAGLKGVENRMYLPRFQGRDNLFYSLSTGSYHYFGGKGSSEDWMNTCEHMNCNWIHI